VAASGGGPRGTRGGAGGSGAWSGFLERFAAAYAAEIAAFLRVARGEAANPCTPQDALRALLIAEACERSRAEHRPVALAEREQAVRARAAQSRRAREAARWT
jgi:myo-inositol 2-dehydrogenase/D-chiro-inositol 1-dehydrogenase